MITPDFFIQHCQWIMPVTFTPQLTKDDLDEDHSLYHSSYSDQLVSIKPRSILIDSNAWNRMESDHDDNGRTTVTKLEQEHNCFILILNLTLQLITLIAFTPIYMRRWRELYMRVRVMTQHENPKQPVLDVHSFHISSMHTITVTLTLKRRRILPHIH